MIGSRHQHNAENAKKRLTLNTAAAPGNTSVAEAGSMAAEGHSTAAVEGRMLEAGRSTAAVERLQPQRSS